MTLVFIWGMLLLFIISALLNKYWVWHLSWNLIPIIAFLVGLVYDINSELTPDVDVVPKKIWSELDDRYVTIINEGEPSIQRRYTGLY
jgi:hypothetical protein